MKAKKYQVTVLLKKVTVLYVSTIISNNISNIYLKLIVEPVEKWKK